MLRVGQNHIYTVYIRYFWLGNHQIYGVYIYVYIRFWPTLQMLFIHAVLANPALKHLNRTPVAHGHLAVCQAEKLRRHFLSG